MSHTTTPKGENQTNITFSDIANNPQGLTPLNDTAKLFNRHAETLRRWVRSDKNPFVKPERSKNCIPLKVLTNNPLVL